MAYDAYKKPTKKKRLCDNGFTINSIIDFSGDPT